MQTLVLGVSDQYADKPDWWLKLYEIGMHPDIIEPFMEACDRCGLSVNDALSLARASMEHHMQHAQTQIMEGVTYQVKAYTSYMVAECADFVYEEDPPARPPRVIGRERTMPAWTLPRQRENYPRQRRR